MRYKHEQGHRLPISSLQGVLLQHQQQEEEEQLQQQTLLTVSICGSYHRHLEQMKKSIAECRQLGIKVLIPKYTSAKSETNGFVILRGENGSPRELQEKNFAAIANSSFVFVEDPHGYIGPSTALEIGYAYAKGIPIYCREKPKEYIFTLFTSFGKSVSEIKSIILEEDKR